MKVIESRIAGVLLFEAAAVSDERGWFAEISQLRVLRAHGVHGEFVRSALSHNIQCGTLRGLHLQRAPHEDAKLVTCVSGRLFDVVADTRRESRTFGQWDAFQLCAEQPQAVYLPAGVAHGFQTLQDATTVLYQIGAYYHRDAGDGVRWDDPTLAITWPLVPSAISEQDQAWGPLQR